MDVKYRIKAHRYTKQQSLQEINHMNNFKSIAYITLAAFVTVAYINPTIAGVLAVTMLVALHLIQQVINFNDIISQVPHASMQDYYQAFSVEPEVIESVVETDEPDVWGLEIDRCELACPVQITAPVQLLLEPATETVKVIDFNTFTYKELQAMVKAVRSNVKDIKLNSTKAKLIEYLKANY